MNKDFFEENETNDFNILNDFNSKLKLNDFGKTPDKYHYDASGITSTGDEVAIEIKRRNQILLDDNRISGCSASSKNGYIDSTIIIEPHKLSQLMLEYVINKKIPLYVNILNNSIVVFNLSRLKDIPNYKSFNNIYSKGYQRKENGGRFELKLEHAYVYIKENDRWIIKKNKNN